MLSLAIAFTLGALFQEGMRRVFKTLQLRRDRKAQAVELEIQRRVNERAGWGDELDRHEAFMLKGTTSGPGPFGPRNVTHPSHSIPNRTW